MKALMSDDQITVNCQEVSYLNEGGVFHVWSTQAAQSTLCHHKLYCRKQDRILYKGPHFNDVSTLPDKTKINKNNVKHS